MDFQSQDSIAVLSLAAKDPYPRLARSVMDDLESTLAQFQRSGLFQGVVITSTAPSFATGAEIEEIAKLHGLEARQFSERGQRLMNSIERCPVPVIAAIRGHCLGGGLDLALACHGRVAAYDASFGHPGGALGLMTGWGGTQRLPRLLGKAAALEILLTGERIPATQALTMGLVVELFPSQDLIEHAVRFAERVALRMSAALPEDRRAEV